LGKKGAVERLEEKEGLGFGKGNDEENGGKVLSHEAPKM